MNGVDVETASVVSSNTPAAFKLSCADVKPRSQRSIQLSSTQTGESSGVVDPCRSDEFLGGRGFRRVIF